MDKNEKFIWSGFAVLAVCMPIGYAAAPFNPNFEILMACIGVMALGASLGALYAGFNVCTTEQPSKASWKDEFYACAEFNEVVSDLDTEADKVERVCDALEKIANVEGAGSFDACDIMACAVEFRERAHELHRRADILAKARRNRKFDGIKELTVIYSSEPMFKGLQDTVQSYLPESFQLPAYLEIDERLGDIYNRISTICDEQK